MILRRIIKHFREQEWTAIFLDFLIVVVGVFVGLQVQQWNEHRTDRAHEQAYLLALRQDFAQVIIELEHDRETFKEIAGAMVTLIEQSDRDMPSISLPELNRAFSYVIYMEGTELIDDTYANLTGSGDLSLIRNQRLKNELASFYTRADLIHLVGNTHELQLVNIYQPYIQKNLDYLAIYGQGRKKHLDSKMNSLLPTKADQKKILSVLDSAEFRNIAAIKYDIVTDLLAVISGALRRARKVDADLEAELEKHQ